MDWDKKAVLITGGAGYLGRQLANYLCMEHKPRRVCIYSRDPHKHEAMRREIYPFDQLRYFVGDVRDERRLESAFQGVDTVVHAAAIKNVPDCEYNPSEAQAINVDGSLAVATVAARVGVDRVVVVSSDKAVDPVNFYGTTKLAAERIAIQQNFITPIYSVVRYGNVVRSTGSVLRYFRALLDTDKKAELPITDRRMTRFWVDAADAIALIEQALDYPPGHIVVGRHQSFKVVDLAKALYQRALFKDIGVREGEKLHETLVGVHELGRAIGASDHIVVRPRSDFGVKLATPKHGKPLTEPYSSAKNDFLTQQQIKERLAGDDYREVTSEYDRLPHPIHQARSGDGGGQAGGPKSSGRSTDAGAES